MDIPLLFDDFALVMLSSPSVCCHIENKNILKEVQTSTGELLLYRTLPNKGCSTFCKTLLEDISKPETKKNDNSFSSQVNLNIEVFSLSRYGLYVRRIIIAMIIEQATIAIVANHFHLEPSLTSFSLLP